MEERFDPGAPQLERLRPGVDGGAFRRPPVLPVVAIFMLLAGLAIGLRLAPTPTQAPTPSPVAVATAPSAAPTAPISSMAPASPMIAAFGATDISYTFCLPAEGTNVDGIDATCNYVLRPSSPDSPPQALVSIERALTAAKTEFGIEPAQVVSARLTDSSTYVEQPATEAHWVWELELRASASGACGVVIGSAPTFDPAPLLCTEIRVIVIDATTGQPLLVTSLGHR